MVGAYYLGLFICVIGKEKWKGAFSLFFLFALLIVFPLSNMFRFSNSFLSLEAIVSNARHIMNGTYNTGNYDAFQMFSAGIQYARIEGYSLGYQMLGVLLFFVPRSIWKTKPIGTGAEVIVHLNNASFSNVSMPLIGEGYVNFGVLGVLIFGIVTGALCSKYDKKYWDSPYAYGTISFIYPSAVPFFFFLNRGDMMSAGSYMIANVVMGLIVRRIFIKEYTIENMADTHISAWVVSQEGQKYI